MNARPLRWWSKAALDDAAARFAPAWRDWGAGWAIGIGPVVAVNAFEPPPEGRLPLAWRRCAADGAWLGAPAASVDDVLERLLFGTPEAAADATASPSPAPMAAEVAAAAGRNLLAALGEVLPPPQVGPADPAAGVAALARRAADLAGGEAGLAHAAAEPAPPTAGWQPWSGAIDIRLGLAAGEATALCLHLAAPTATALLAGRVPSASPVALPSPEPIARAFERRSIRLSVELAGLQLDLGTLQSLRTGDVLALQHRLDEPLHLCLPRASLPRGADAALCAALLGTRDGRRAVELVRPTAIA